MVAVAFMDDHLVNLQPRRGVDKGNLEAIMKLGLGTLMEGGCPIVQLCTEHAGAGRQLGVVGGGGFGSASAAG